MRALRQRKRDAAIDWLAVTFSAVFGPEVRPLAIGADGQIWILAKTTRIGRKALEAALKRRTNSPAYLEALGAGGAMRFDLEGQPVERVAAEHREIAIAVKTERARIRNERAISEQEHRP